MNRSLLALLLVMPAFAGCLQGDDAVAPAADADAAPTKADAGAVGGPAPAAPKDAFRVAATDGEAGEAQETTAHPMRLPTNPARDPVELTLEGAFAPQDCTGIGISPVAVSWRNHNLQEHLKQGDVFAYDVELTYENSDSSWAEIHMVYGFGNTIEGHNDPVSDVRGPVVINFTGQSYRVNDQDPAFANVFCWYGQTTQPIPYTLRVKLVFAEDAVPAQSPVLVPVPEGASRLIVTGVPLDPAKGVNSHFRVFGPDDDLVCECGLASNAEGSFVELEAPGDYVVLVDHTANGFVSLALDAPTDNLLRALDAEWTIHTVWSGEATQNLDQVVELNLDSVPLLMHAWSRPADGENAGIGKKVVVEVTNSRGTPLKASWGGYLTTHLPPLWNLQWWGIWPADWGYEADHHAYATGQHTVRISGDVAHGDVEVIVRQYVRP